jgi:four helix bundle protein
MNNMKSLEVYKRTHALIIKIYKITEAFPKSEMFGLVSQMRRAAVSINSNLSEGGARNKDGEYKQFINIAQGSAGELEYQITLSRDLGYIEKTYAGVLINETEQILKMLIGLSKSIKC